MSLFILDASALLALVLNEPGNPIVRARLTSSVIGAVNFAEVVTKLTDLIPIAVIQDMLAQLDLEVVAFDEAQAVAAGRLRKETRHLGLSLGDRACLALTEHLGGTALTTDKAWLKIDAGPHIELIR